MKYITENGGYRFKGIVSTSSKLADWSFLLQTSLFNELCFTTKLLFYLLTREDAKSGAHWRSASWSSKMYFFFSWPKTSNQAKWELSFFSYFWICHRPQWKTKKTFVRINFKMIVSFLGVTKISNMFMKRFTLQKGTKNSELLWSGSLPKLTRRKSENKMAKSIQEKRCSCTHMWFPITCTLGQSRYSWNKIETLQGNSLALQNCYCHTETFPELSSQGD